VSFAAITLCVAYKRVFIVIVVYFVDRRETFLEGVDWIHPAQNSDQWQAVVNTVMNLRVP